MKTMPEISRRDLLAAGLSIAGATCISRSAWGLGTSGPVDHAAAGSAEIPATQSPREHLLFDFGWNFKFGHGSDPARDFGFGFSQGTYSKAGDFKIATAGFDDSNWRPLNLPHDWAVELPFVHDDEDDTFHGVDPDYKLVSHGYKPLGRRFPETSVGWYRREFDVPASDRGRRISVEFDGALRDSLIFVNGCLVGRSDSGYVPFRFDITDFLTIGAKNCLAVRVDASLGDGWYYEGAGIYRHVWLTKADALHLERFESTVRTELSGNRAILNLATVVMNEGERAEIAKVLWKITDVTGKVVATAEAPAQSIAVDGKASYSASAKVSNPALWSVREPNLYSAVVIVESDGKVRDQERVSFGIRSAVFDPDKGFLLNGKPMKIQGTCNHQDHAGVGVALPDRLQVYRVKVLQDMGCNSVRTSHNMPTPEWVEACDRLGMTMMCETRQMSSSPEGLAQLEAMIKRYRNSPSIILWSIGNEEALLQGKMAEQGQKIAATMVRRCHELDPTRQVSAAVHGENTSGLSLALDIIGFNYDLRNPESYHSKNPSRAIFGSETASAFSTRGVYSTDPLRNVFSAYDTNRAEWGETAEQWWAFYGARQWAAGGYAWTGFDYRGEPWPYSWPAISSQFGILDTCGFPKDTFYYYKALWAKKPVLHLFPHWNFEGREGEEIPVWVYSNLEEVELFVNGKSAGSQRVPRLGHVQWNVGFEPGYIEARGSRNGQVELSERRETTGPAAAIRLTADRTEIDADGEDIAILTVEALDSKGRPVPTASSHISFAVTGEGAFIGVGNGDPNCHESDKGPSRSLFNGLAQVIVQAAKTPGEIRIDAKRDGGEGPELVPAKIVIRTRQVESRPSVPTTRS
jgi:beta-galactosidase